MNMFFGGGAAFAATLLASSVLFYANPLFAETPAQQQQPASTQQEKKENNETAPAQSEQEAEARQALEPAVTAVSTGVAPAAVADKTGALSANISTETVTFAAPSAEAITAPQAYVATAYSLPGRTASGMRVAKGVIAADPRVLPLGTRVRLEAGPYSGEYIVADTGSAVRGRKIDVWVPSHGEACRFGRRNIKLSVISYGGRRAATRQRSR
ncbi:MAG TPA: 3D domain-containing protein [Pyrinomonadaceae bacterium]|jgi:3D (Asp-Asp-Asp) domain-containing protein